MNNDIGDDQYDSATATEDIYSYPPLPASGVTILGIVVIACCKKQEPTELGRLTDGG